MQFTNLPWPRDHETTRKATWLMRNLLLVASAVFVAWLARNQVLVLIKGILSYLLALAFRKWSSDVREQVITAPPPDNWKIRFSSIITWTNVSLFVLLVMVVGTCFIGIHHLEPVVRILRDTGRRFLAYVFQPSRVANSPPVDLQDVATPPPDPHTHPVDPRIAATSDPHTPSVVSTVAAPTTTTQ